MTSECQMSVNRHGGGVSGRYDAYGTANVRPAIYLKFSAQITSGSGSSDDPFTLSL